MREFELNIDEALKKGLAPEAVVPLNSQWLYECLGFRCGRLGLEAFVEGSNPLPSSLDMYYNWPFPQMLMGDAWNILVIRDSVSDEDILYSVSNDMSTVTHIFTLDTLTFPKGDLMEVADFGEYVFMTNGAMLLYWNVAGFWNVLTGLSTIPLMNTICNFKGQGVGGGVRSTWYDCDQTFYVWSKIGSMDFTPEQDNEAGYRRCPYGGTVYSTRRLGDGVVGYSSKGVTLLHPVADPSVTFGFKKLVPIGIINKGAMNGDENEQVYVGTDLVVRKITKEGVQELGFKHLMDNLDDEDIIVSFDKSKRDFYIGNSEKTYLLSQYGMTEIQQHPSTVWRIDPDEVHMLPDTVDTFYPLITSEAFDFGYKGQKTIQTIETDAFLMEDPYAAVDYAFDQVVWGSTNFSPINNMGIATIPAAGNLFRAKVRFDSVYNLFRIGYIKARYKMTDLRGIRGVYAPPPRGQ